MNHLNSPTVANTKLHIPQKQKNHHRSLNKVIQWYTHLKFSRSLSTYGAAVVAVGESLAVAAVVVAADARGLNFERSVRLFLSLEGKMKMSPWAISVPM